MWDATGEERALEADGGAGLTQDLPPSPLLLRARAHLARHPLPLPPGRAGGWLARQVADDPSLLRALGGLRPHELFAAFEWSVDDDAADDLAAGIGERILATMRWLGLGCLEAALATAREASLDADLAGRIGSSAARTPGSCRLLLAAGLPAEHLPRLSVRGSLAPDTTGAMRALYGAHRPELAELRLRAFAAARWDFAAQPILRETVLALHGLTPAPSDSMVRGAVGGGPWGRARATPIGEVGARTRIRILLEVLRRVDGAGLGPASGLALLAGLGKPSAQLPA